MYNTREIKSIIIENYIDWFTSNEDERAQMKEDAKSYVDEDWVDEIAQFIQSPTKQPTTL